MRTFFFRCALICAIAALTTACSEENDSKEEFKISAIVAPLTRAPQLNENGEGKFTNGDQNTLFFFTNDTKPISTFLYTYGHTYFWNDLKLPTNETEFTLTGCYPPVKEVTGSNILWNASIDNAQNELLFSAPQKVQKGATANIPLTFKHVLHKICIELVTDKTSITDEMEKDARIECRNVLPIAHISLKEGRSTNASGIKTSFSYAGKKAYFVIPPQQTGNIEIGIHINQKEFNYRLSEKLINGNPLQELKEGFALTIKIAVSNESFSILGQEINAWEEQGEITDSIIF